ncbi:hypothetical protein [Cytophaga hutchinsonii]|uniref:hypothetical protein n=1 Tax=Cytophaga hutchinsonii TaxID=985 RepID=UPI0015A5D7F4|nr:hypothetical protein [Cytophaga hutchinsonii]
MDLLLVAEIVAVPLFPQVLSVVVIELIVIAALEKLTLRKNVKITSKIKSALL